MRLAVVVMAAGIGTRMKSKLPKVMHPLLGKPLLSYVLTAVKPLTPSQIVIVTGHESNQVQTRLTQEKSLAGMPVSFVLQSPQLGTGHAVQQAHQETLRGQADAVLVMPGDLPLLSAETMRQLVDAYQSNHAPVVMLTVTADDPRGFGRIVRDAHGYVSAIVEEVDCTPTQQAIRELNVGAYLFNAEWLWQNLSNLPLSAKGEYYITDLVAMAVAQGKQVQPELLADPIEAVGVNTRVHLAEAERVLRQRINRNWMLAGVSIPDPATTYIDTDVVLGQDTVVLPNTHLRGNTIIGEDCVIGPNSYVENSTIGHGCHIRFSVLEGATVENHVDIGPFGRLRKGAHLASGVHMGNFGEVKNSYLGPGTKMGHFSYLGDATTGEHVNIGAGAITCNYDGVRKYPTVIGNNAFIGSDTMLVAPVNIGENSITGAGSVVTHDVPDNSLAYGVPARLKQTD
jgi:bifunctional UDP-N-acetylglucosamine pyrophosphorylase/glucosamine-1-phosphate N-acetyltransferase